MARVTHSRRFAKYEFLWLLNTQKIWGGDGEFWVLTYKGLERTIRDDFDTDITDDAIP